MDTSSATGSNAAAASFVAVFVIAYIVFICALLALSIWIHWRILAKAGYNGALSLLILTGIGGLIIVLLLAFGHWPIEDELDRLRAGVRPAAPPGSIGGPPATTTV